ncbi:MAG: hypothetical protein ACOZDY_21035 [Pseudomonadota bacterium]
MSSDRTSNAPERDRRRRRVAGLAIAAVVPFFVAYAIAVLREHAVPGATAEGPLQVRTDLMRGQPCHVAEQVIMGECTPDEIASLQREAAAAAGGR